MAAKRTLSKWMVLAFAALAAGAVAARGELHLTNVEEAKRTLWSLQPIGHPEPPAVKDAAWCRGPVDRFVLAKLEAAGLRPSPEADRRTLVRRLYFDLLGLPPTQEQVEKFVGDKRADAYQRLVDELLANPGYGERWGRHWLDVARYADTKGYVGGENDTRYTYAWTYRDYVIRSFNEDKPYDRFILEQVAADQLDLGADKRPLAAMGFLTVGRRFINNIHDITDDRIDVVTRGLMGLTVQCARCHDHKYDPIPTADYYALYGVFRSSGEPEELPQIETPSPTAEFKAFKAELDKRQAAVDAYLADRFHVIVDEIRSRTGDYLVYVAKTWAPGKHYTPSVGSRGALRRGMAQAWRAHLHRARAEDAVWGAWVKLAKLKPESFAADAKAAVAKLPESLNPQLRKALAEHPPESLEQLAEVYGKLLEDAYRQWGEAAKKNPAAQKLDDPAWEQLRLAVMGPDSPATLTQEQSRQKLGQGELNHLEGLQRKVSQWRAESSVSPACAMVMQDEPHPFDPHVLLRGNPGANGPAVPRRFLTVLGGQLFTHGSGRLELAKAIASPDNPLTARVMVNRIWQGHFGVGLVRTASDFGARGEPPSHPELLSWLARRFIDGGWSIKKLHREIVLSATYRQSSGDRADGEARDPENRMLWRMNRRRLDFEELHDAMLAVARRLDPAVGGRPVELTRAPFPTRRAVYGFIDRQNLPAMFGTFDFPSPDASAPSRPVTVVPQQTLFLLNSPFVLEQADKVAQLKAVHDAADPAAKVRAVYAAVLDRTPGDAELHAAEQLAGPADERSLSELAQALMMCNEFMFVD